MAMASALFSKRTTNDNTVVAEEDEVQGKRSNPDVSEAESNGVEDKMPAVVSPADILASPGFTRGAGAGADVANSEIMNGSNMETTSKTSDAATIAVEGGKPTNKIIVAPGQEDQPQNNPNSITEAINGDTSHSPPPKWSIVLSTPSTHSVFTPSTDHSSAKYNLHGLGLKDSYDRTKRLSRTGKQCASLLFDVASLYDDLAGTLTKLCPSVLQQATHNTPLEGFGKDVIRAVSSFTVQTQNLATSLTADIARPYQDNATGLFEESSAQYARYTSARGKCHGSRKEALKLRQKYVHAAREVETAVANLQKARAKRGRKRKTTEDSENSKEIEGGGDAASSAAAAASSNNGNDGKGDDNNGANSTWQEELRSFGTSNNLTKHCEAVVRTAEEVQAAQTRYGVGVAEENACVDECQDAERGVLDAAQRLEEERIVFLIGLLDRFLQDEKESLEDMSLDLAAVEPLNLADGNHTELTVPSSALPSTTTSSLFSPRRRAQSDDGPAINETRLLGLPDNIAEIRDNMKSLIGRLLGRLKTLHMVAAFNEGVATAIEGFATSLKGQLESNPATGLLKKHEGACVLGSWNSVMGSLEMYAQYAEVLAKQIRRGNAQLQQTLQTAQKDTKTFQEKEEFRWKALCDAARVETKAKLKHQQCVADLEKARARLVSAEGDEGENGSGGDKEDNNKIGSINLTPLKSTKMDRHMNKAMGKMFSILPGGGEDVMNKVLTPQQRQAIANRQLDEAQAKEERGTESFEVARSVKQQATVSYETEAEAASFKFKSSERDQWSEMQQSLVSCVEALQCFRDGQLNSIVSAIDAMRGNHRGGKALEDATQWTILAEGRVKEQQDRSVAADDAKEEGNQFESGFSLKVQLVDCMDVQDVIRRFLDEEDVIVDEAVDIGEAEDVETDELAPKEESNGDVPNEEISTPPTPPLPDVAPDPLMEKMDEIFSKKLNNVSIDKYYEVGWSDVEAPLYRPWLEKKGSFDVSVSDWEHSSDEFENAWSKEKFAQKRTIKFKFKRTTHLYIGPPVAGVTQTQYLKKDGNDRCVVMMTVEMDGIPYSDVFAVEVRWSARRVEQNNIAIDAGVFVRFTKSSMFASKIKSGTLKETSPIHLDLFEVIKAAIASGEDGGGTVSLNVEPDYEPKPEPKREVKLSVEEPQKETIPGESLSENGSVITQFESTINQLVSAFFSLTQTQQMLLGFVALYFVAKMFFGKRDQTLDTIDDLTQKVNELTDEVREMKVLLQNILSMSEQLTSRQMSCSD